MIKLKHKQTGKEWNYSATVWFKRKYDINDYDILEWYDVVELFHDRANRISNGKMEKRDAVKIIDEQHYIGYWFEEIENPENVEQHKHISDLLDTESEIFATKEQFQDLNISGKPIEEKDFPFEFLKILFEKGGLNNKIDVTKTLDGYFPLDKYKPGDILSQDLAIKHFLYPLREDKLIKYDTFIMNDDLGKPYIYRWNAAITKDGIDFYLRLSERIVPIKMPEIKQKTPRKAIDKVITVFDKTIKWTINKILFICLWVLITVIGGLILACAINYFQHKGFKI